MDKSVANLKEAFAGESQANRTYLAFAEKADREGYPQVARLFRAAAEAETIHALNHLRALKAIQTTAENLKSALAGEVAEFEQMYPRMIAAAQAEGHKEAERTFNVRQRSGKGPRPPLSGSPGAPGGEGTRGNVRLSDLRLYRGRRAAG